jgi:cell division protein ZapE
MANTQASAFMTQYRQAIASGRLTADPAQEQAVKAFDALYQQLVESPPPRRLFRLFSAPTVSASGLYLWGDVGRGKSMLMDLFSGEIKKHKKTRRVHFHAFMLDVHKRLFCLRQGRAEQDLMPHLIADLAEEAAVLCLDEMQVSDVTDAMILSRLFSGLMDAGVTVVFTSNRPPHELYQGGLQREQFEKFIDLLEERMPIVQLASPTDYRLQQLRAMARTYMYPRDEAADDFLLDSWEKLTGGAPSEPLRIDVQGRVLRIDKQVNGIAWLTFAELCVRPLGANDYLELAKVCHTLLLQGIPALTPDSRNEAKRFVTLIDTLYDHRVKLVATAETAPEDIYPAGDGNFEFHRTVSRLMEMQSEQYLALAHLH